MTLTTDRYAGLPGVCPISGQTVAEEIANSLTHGAGFLLSIAGLVVLAVFSALYGNAWHIVSCSIYGATLAVLYASSTIYHALPTSRLKRLFRVADHTSTYLLIAGTYTPFALVTLNGGWGWSIFGVVWGLATVGIAIKMLPVRLPDRVSTLIYLGIGWICIIAIVPLWHNLPLGGIIWLAAGGLAYSTGVAFYTLKKLAFQHTYWHLAVLAGSLCHFLVVLFYVVL